MGWEKLFCGIRWGLLIAILTGPLAFVPSAKPSIHDEAQNGDIQALSSAAKQSIDALDCCIMTPLMIATRADRVGAMQVLLDRGADVNRCHPLLGTPLMIAVSQENVEAVKLLLARGANARIHNRDGDDAITYADHAENREIARLLSATTQPALAAGGRAAIIDPQRSDQSAGD
jgi:ankyrin repeat protein